MQISASTVYSRTEGACFFQPYCGNVEVNVSSQASSAGTAPTHVSSMTFLDSALSQNTNLDLKTTAWMYIRDLTIEDILPPRVVQTIHPTVKVCFQDCCVVVLGKIHDDPSDELAWKLMFLLPRMLLTPLARRGKHSLHDVKAAYHQFLSWNWSDLICLRASLPGSHTLLGIMQEKACSEAREMQRVVTCV